MTIVSLLAASMKDTSKVIVSQSLLESPIQVSADQIHNWLLIHDYMM